MNEHADPTGDEASSSSGIGTLNEGSLHAALKHHYAREGDRFEVPLDGMVIDLVRPDGHLVEIQTGTFAALGSKFDRIVDHHRVLLVHPISVRTVLERPDGTRRTSPKKGRLTDLFDQLVSMPTLLDHPNFELDIVLVETVRAQVWDPKARRRRGGWRTADRRLDAVVETHRFRTTDDLRRFVPDGLPEVFTTADLADRSAYNRDVAQKIAFCLRATGAFEVVDRTRAGIRYRLGGAGGLT